MTPEEAIDLPPPEVDVTPTAIDALNAEVAPKAPEPVPPTIVTGGPGPKDYGIGTPGVGGPPPLDLTGGPNLSDIISALRAAKTMDEVDAAEDLSRHMRLTDPQRAEVKTEAQTAEKRIANS